MKKPEIKDYDSINGPGAYDYISDVNEYINGIQSQLEKRNEEIRIRKAIIKVDRDKLTQCRGKIKKLLEALKTLEATHRPPSMEAINEILK